MKHYVKIDENNNIIKTFSSAFEEPIEGDICIKENTEERHFNMDLISNYGTYKYKYENNEIIEKTEQELYNEYNIDENKLKKLCEIRNQILLQTDFIQSRHIGELQGLEKGITTKPTSLTEEEYNQWLLYREALRDLPDMDLSGVNIENIMSVFPVMPDMKLKTKKDK